MQDMTSRYPTRWGSCVDRIPLRSPLSNGVALADEVGIGKTIEAGLVLLQLWSRRKRRLLVVAPATLRRQWATELTEKFGLPALVLDKDGYAASRSRNPFDDERHILVCSYHFAAQHAADVRQVPWDPPRTHPLQSHRSPALTS